MDINLDLYHWNKDTDEITRGRKWSDISSAEHRVDLTWVRTPFGTLRISTVFLPFDHAFGDGPPVLFETMVFNGPWHEWQERYCTPAEARAGHVHAVKIAKQARYRLDWWLSYWWSSYRWRSR